MPHTNETRATRATLDTPEGTVLVLRKTEYATMLAQDGALAVVDGDVSNGRHASRTDYLPVAWLKGHGGDFKGSPMVQADGGYNPEDFVISPVQVGERVTTFTGHEGEIVAIPAAYGDDCDVLIKEYDETLPYPFSALEKRQRTMREFIEELEKATLHVLDNWTFLAPTKTTYNVGDRVNVTHGTEYWDGPGTITDIYDDIVVVETDAGDTGGFKFSEVEHLMSEPEDPDQGTTPNTFLAGYNAGFGHGYNMGYDEGHDDGRKDGYDIGFEDALDVAEIARGSVA